ncbi:MAG: Por secretion system protein [Prevotella sp.]|nr:Por secretion system protein [Prevotella sp.]
MKSIRYILAALALAASLTTRALTADEWTAYLALGDITRVVAADKLIYALAGDALYSVSTSDYSVTVYDKMHTLSDTSISLIEWCSAAKKLVVVYSNQNIDLLTNDGQTENLPDLNSYVTTNDKTVNAIDIDGDDAYLSTNFGIVRINVKKAEVTNTYNFGQRVAWVHISGNTIYAECPDAGQYSASMSDNLLDPASWTLTSTKYTAKSVTNDPDLLYQAEQYRPNAPAIGYFAFMRIVDGVLYTVPGMDEMNTPRTGAVQIFDGQTWTSIVGDTGLNAEPRFRNMFCIDVDPTNPNRWLVGAVPGLYEYLNGTITQCYYSKNSILERPAAGVPENDVNYTEVNTVRFDEQGNAWIIQSVVATPGIICLKKDGSFTRYEHPELMLPAGFSWARPTGFDYSSTGLMWFTNNEYRTPALASYNRDTDELITYTEFINEDNSKIDLTVVPCWAEDLDGNIWIGTTVGPAYLAKEDIGNTGAAFQQPKIPRKDDPTLADYLLANVSITAMAVDAGNRKWFGTENNGIYLISADNMEQIEHFTAENSPLLSNNIEAIALNNANGLVYIATDKGLCSYSSAVVETAETLVKDDIYAYPNPVRPDYDGLVTIVGLSYNAQVTITTAAGTLVKKGTATGGSFSWDCTDQKGRRVASGVYPVLIASEDGKASATCKIAVVR